MRFVFVTDELPRLGSAGHLSLNHAVIAWLGDAHHEVTILLTRPRFSWPIEHYSIAVVAGPSIASWRKFIFANTFRSIIAILTRRILGGLPAPLAATLRRRLRIQTYGTVDAVIGAYITPVQSAWCAARILGIKPDAILTDTIFRAPLLREPGLQHFNSVIFAPDLFHRRHLGMSATGYRVYPPQLSDKKEAGLLRLAKTVAAIQPEEAAEISSMCPAQNVCITMLPALPCPPPANQRKEPGRLVFIGSDTLPNIDGLHWFFAEVWPHLRRSYPAVTLDLVGDCGAAIGRLPAGVSRLGRVKNVSDSLHRAMLAIAPLRVSSGLKIKILDYARHGLVTVMTPESLRGFAADVNAPFVVATDAEAFSGAILAKLIEPEPEDAQRALNYVAKHYNADVSFSGLAAALNIPVRTKNREFT